MSDQIQPSQPALPPPGETGAPEGQGSSRRFGATQILVGVFLAFIGVLVLGFILALIAAFLPDSASKIQVIRDFFIIAMALEGIVIGAALIVLVLQLARLTNLLQNEIKPILEQTSDTVKTVRGTATFVSRNVAAPVIRASGYLSFLLAFLRELFGLRRAVRGKRKAESPVRRRERGE